MAVPRQCERIFRRFYAEGEVEALELIRVVFTTMLVVTTVGW